MYEHVYKYIYICLHVYTRTHLQARCQGGCCAAPCPIVVLSAPLRDPAPLHVCRVLECPTNIMYLIRIISWRCYYSLHTISTQWIGAEFVLYVYTDYYKTYNVNTLQVQLQYIISYLRILWLHLPHEQHRVVECWYRVGALILIMYRIYITLYHVCALILIMYMIYTTQSGSDHSWYHTRTLSIIEYVTHTLYVKIQRLSYDSINTHVTRTTHSGRVFVSCTCAHPYNVYHVYDIYTVRKNTRIIVWFY